MLRANTRGAAPGGGTVGSKMTQRICFRLRIRPDEAEEYVRAPPQVWPEMLDALAGRRLAQLLAVPRRDGMLIGYLECEDFAAAQAAMAATEVNGRWQAEMAEFFTGARTAAGPTRACCRAMRFFNID